MNQSIWRQYPFLWVEHLNRWGELFWGEYPVDWGDTSPSQSQWTFFLPRQKQLFSTSQERAGSLDLCSGLLQCFRRPETNPTWLECLGHGTSFKCQMAKLLLLLYVYKNIYNNYIYTITIYIIHKSWQFDPGRNCKMSRLLRILWPTPDQWRLVVGSRYKYVQILSCLMKTCHVSRL